MALDQDHGGIAMWPICRQGTTGGPAGSWGGDRPTDGHPLPPTRHPIASHCITSQGLPQASLLPRVKVSQASRLPLLTAPPPESISIPRPRLALISGALDGATPPSHQTK